MEIRFIVLVCCLLFSKWSVAQERLVTPVVADTVVAPSKVPKTNTHDSLVATTSSPSDSIIVLPFVTPKKKAMFAAVLPGLGQIYNKQYWKLPLVYGALGFGAYQIYYKNDRYNYYRRIYAGRLSNKAEFLNMEANIPIDGIKYYQDAFRQERDMAALLTILGYGLQIMDALVFAHLKEFDISEDITMKFKPTLLPNYYTTVPTMGVSMVLQFKK